MKREASSQPSDSPLLQALQQLFPDAVFARMHQNIGLSLPKNETNRSKLWVLKRTLEGIKSDYVNSCSLPCMVGDQLEIVIKNSDGITQEDIRPIYDLVQEYQEENTGQPRSSEKNQSALKEQDGRDAQKALLSKCEKSLFIVFLILSMGAILTPQILEHVNFRSIFKDKLNCAGNITQFSGLGLFMLTVILFAVIFLKRRSAESISSCVGPLVDPSNTGESAREKLPVVA